MTLRTLRCITLTILSHLLLVPLAFTTQLPSAIKSQAASPAPLQEVTIKAREQSKQDNVYTLEGDIEIDFEGYILRAEHATYNEPSGEIEASGRVVFEGGPHDAHLTATRAAYNVKSETGAFYEVAGTFGAIVRGQTVVLTTSNPFVVAAAAVEKVGPNRYIVSHGSITSCADGGLRWKFESQKIDLVAGDDAKLYHSSFRLMKFPVFYIPYTKLPASARSRNSGFELPTVGNSSSKGFILGESVFWAIDRSNDITVGSEYFSERGWSQSVHIRSRPGENSSIDVRYFGVQDRGAPETHQDQGGNEVRLVGDTVRDHWRGSASIDYLSSFLFRQAFSTSYTQAVNSEVQSVAYLSHNLAGYSLNLDAERYQNFFQPPSLTPTVIKTFDQVRILHLPMAEFNALEHPFGNSPLRWGVDASAGGLQRSEPGFVTANLVGRLGARPRLAAPLHWNGWDVRPEIAVQDTLYTQQVTGVSDSNPLGVAGGSELNRHAVEANLELRPPAMEKVFERPLFGYRLKHVIEPILTYNYVNGVENFQNIIRFDQVDILSDTNEFEYDLIQRIYGRRTGPAHPLPGCEASAPAAPGAEKLPPEYIPGVSAPPVRCAPEGDAARELLSWEIKQKYFVDRTFGGALLPGRRNVLATTADLTGIAFLFEPRSWSPIVSRLRVQATPNTDVQWQLDYDSVRGRINSSATFLEYRIGEYFAGLSHAFFREPPNTIGPTFSNAPQSFDQIRYLVGYGHPNKRGLAGGFSMGYDTDLNFLQYAAGQSSYNWDCCGVSFEYRHINVPGVNVENQYRFAFTLANIGSFGNLRRQERLY